MNNNNTDNKDTFIESDSLEIGTLKIASKIGQLKNKRKYISSNDVEKLQDSLLRIVENEKHNDEYSVIFLTSKKD